MKKSDFMKFKALWCSVLENYGNPVSDPAVILAFNALAQFSLPEIQEALLNHVQTSEFKPAIKDVFKYCNERQQRLQTVAGLNRIQTERYGIVWGSPVDSYKSDVMEFAA